MFGIAFTIVFKIIRPNGIPKIWAVPEFSLEKAKNCLILSFTFLGNVMAGITALSKVNIPIFLAFRRLTVLFMFVADLFVLKKEINLIETTGVFFITVGAVMAGVIIK